MVSAVSSSETTSSLSVVGSSATTSSSLTGSSATTSAGFSSSSFTPLGAESALAALSLTTPLTCDKPVGVFNLAELSSVF